MKPLKRPITSTTNKENGKQSRPNYQSPSVSSSQDVPSDDSSPDITPPNSQVERPSTSGAALAAREQIQSADSSITTGGETEMAQLPGTAMGQGGGGDGNAAPGSEIFVEDSPYTNFGRKMSTYRKVHRFLTFGIANTFIEKNVTGENQRWLTTALAEIPWHKPVAYMTPSEFQILPPGCYVSEVRARIVHRGTRIAFETGSSTTGLATLNQIQNVIVGFGLNKSGWGTSCSYTAFNATEPMLPTTIGTPSYSNYQSDWYGVSNNTLSGTSSIPCHQIGFKTPLRNYFSMVTKTTSDVQGGVPCLQELLNMFDGKTTINQVIGEYKYKPKFGMLTAPLRHYRWGLPSFGTAPGLLIPTNGNRQDMITSTVFATTGSGGDDYLIGSTAADTQTPSTFGYTTSIEKSQVTKQGAWGDYHGAQIQPSLHIGVQAIPALTTTVITSPVSSWTDAQADFEVILEMDVVEYTPTKFPFAASANVPAGDIILINSSDSVDEHTCTFAGLYPVNNIKQT